MTAIPIEKLVIALADAMVRAREYLDQESTNTEGQLPAETLATGFKPKFSLDELVFDLSFVVDELAGVDLDDFRLDLTDNLVLTDNELTSLLRNGPEPTVRRFKLWLEEYLRIKSLLRTLDEQIRAAGGIAAFASGGANAIAGLNQSVPTKMLTLEDLRILQDGASQAAIRKLQRLLRDFQIALATIERVTKIVKTGGLPTMLVNIDSEALDNSRDGTIQKMRLVFRSDESSAVTLPPDLIESDS